ncbi:hypothetical protein GCM10011491_00970 [Brucella endophytica]|uniref:Uncharacterized protein n=1 Tax=Brucella endophytica TaxID=1963359 RepID=A0A916RZ18_9HYPH|nr:hypothetical protein [Brucella endophytica]GGA77615.1 hypothetical protein GCM10011491_00970 [Brucella endophytica]
MLDIMLTEKVAEKPIRLPAEKQTKHFLYCGEFRLANPLHLPVMNCGRFVSDGEALTVIKFS